MSYALTYLRYYHGCFREYMDRMERRLKRRFRDPGLQSARIKTREPGKKDRPFTKKEVAVFEYMLAGIQRPCEENAISFFVDYVPQRTALRTTSRSTITSAWWRMSAAAGGFVW